MKEIEELIEKYKRKVDKMERKRDALLRINSLNTAKCFSGKKYQLGSVIVDLRELSEKLKELSSEARSVANNEDGENVCDHDWQTIFYMDKIIIGEYCPKCKEFKQT